MAKGNITITGKYKDVDLSKFNEEQLHYVFTLIKQLEDLQEKLDYLEKTKKIYTANRKLMYKMILTFNFQQNSWNDKIAENAKKILDEVKSIREELGMKPLKLPVLKSEPKPTS